MYTQYLKTAYTLLPPPLSALPAKYWTSISLWLHSYTVARTFQELLKLAKLDREIDGEEAFIIGFLHDFTQKLGKTPETLRTTFRWVYDKLVNDLGSTPREARKIGKVLETNPAETTADPLYPRKTWKLLQLADQLQGSSDALTWAMRAKETLAKEFGRSYNISVYSINLPQPRVRSRLWELLEEQLHSGEILAIASLQGLVVLSKEPISEIKVSWDKLIGRSSFSNETDALSPDDINALKKHVDEGCKNSKKKTKEKGKEKSEKEKVSGSHFSKFAVKYCMPGKKGERAGTYRLLLHYYGNERDPELESLYLPSYTKTMLNNVEITGVKYEEGEFLCPICGARHREGFVVGIIGTIMPGTKSEKWNRFLTLSIHKNLNRILREDKNIRICPLCMLDVLLEAKTGVKGYTVYYTLSFKTPMSLHVIHEVAGVMYGIINSFFKEARKPSTPNINNIKIMLEYPLDFINNVKTRYIDVLHNNSGASISTNGATWFNGKQEEMSIEDKSMLVSAAGTLAYYGLYPVTISVGCPPSLPNPSETLISYEVTYPLYNYTPSTEDKTYKQPVTPYVASVLSSLPKLYRERDNPETRRFARHVEDILGFSPEHAPLMLLYSNPSLYSRVSGLISKFIGMR